MLTMTDELHTIFSNMVTHPRPYLEKTEYETNERYGGLGIHRKLRKTHLHIENNMKPLYSIDIGCKVPQVTIVWFKYATAAPHLP